MTPLDVFELPLGGVRLIEANAGTGKTHTITTLCLRLLLERRLDIGQMLVVTYTNAATAELRRKIRGRIHAALAALRGEPIDHDETLLELARRRRAAGDLAGDCRRLEAALYGFDEAAIFTIHGFCQRVLQEHAFESGVPFDVELLGDDRVLLAEAVRDFWSRELYAAPPDFVAFLHDKKRTPASVTPLAQLAVVHPGLRVIPAESLGAASGADDPAEQWLRLQRGLAASLPAELRRRKQAAQVQSFDDLLQRVADALHGPGAAALVAAMRRRYPAALIDEFQDTDPVQYRIFDTIHGGGDGALFLIGDPKQAIYGFRGADVFAYMRAKAGCGADVYTLGVNRRSGPSLVRAVNSLFAGAAEPFVLPGIPFFPSSAAPDARDRLAGTLAGRGPLRVLFVRRRDSDRKWINGGRGAIDWLYAAVAAEIARLLEADARLGTERVVAGDIAVLCRTNEQTGCMQTALAGLGVRSVLQGDASVFETVEALHVERVVRALADPSDTGAMTAALLTPLIGLTGDSLFAARGDEREWEQWIERFQAWHDVWQRSGFTAAFRRLLDDREAPARILGTVGGERSLTNVLHLGELLQAASAQTRRGPLALVEWLQRMRSNELLRMQEAAESAQIRLESDSHALKLVTVHKSKGLQYPIVVCPFLWNKAQISDSYRCFHDAAADDRLTVDLINADASAVAVARERMAESLRLLYVALTRAEQLCLVVWGAFRFCGTSPLGYLLHQPSEGDHDVGQATERRVGTLSDDAMRADLERLAAASGGAIEVVELLRQPGTPLTPERAPAAPLMLRTASRALMQRWRLASFSALAAAERAVPEPAEEGIDRDELADDAAAALAADDRAAVRAFPRGRRLGTLVHRLFETADFVSTTRDTLRTEAARLLPSYGMDAEWAEALADTVCDVLDTPLTAAGEPVRLRDVSRERRLTELEFVFPVALAADESGLGTFTAERLAAVYAAHGRGWMAGEYAERLRGLPFAPLSGYLKGYIDLVFAAHGRWYVADYKTNDLGPRASDYDADRLVREMQRHHYVLQAHLYAVAVHRYLRRRMPDYAYERDFGGVLYLFVRGMGSAQAPGGGVFFDRPDEALIEALSEALAQPATNS